jgi:hypothetical protein
MDYKNNFATTHATVAVQKGFFQRTRLMYIQINIVYKKVIIRR